MPLAAFSIGRLAGVAGPQLGEASPGEPVTSERYIFGSKPPILLI